MMSEPMYPVSIDYYTLVEFLTVKMPRAKTPDSENSDAEEGLADLEMQKLARQLRIMEGDRLVPGNHLPIRLPMNDSYQIDLFHREAYTLETQNLIRKQRNEIEQLEKEKKELLKDLRLAESRSNQVSDETNADTLKSIVDARGDSSLVHSSKFKNSSTSLVTVEFQSHFLIFS